MNKTRRFHSFLPLFLLMTLVTLVACNEPEEDKLIWQRLGDFPGTARASATTFVIGDKAYVLLGRSGPRAGFLKDVWAYDIPTDTWTRMADFPGKPRVKAVAGVVDGKAYVGLGAIAAYQDSSLYRDWWQYNPTDDTWTQMTDFPDKARNDLFCATVNGKIYTTMGFDGGSRCRETYCYDPLTNTWSMLAKAPETYSGKAGFSLGDDFYVGTGFRGNNLVRMFKYNTVNDRWSRIENIPHGRTLGCGLSVAGKGYVLLGRFWSGALNGGRLLNDVAEYDPITKGWTQLKPFPGGARQNVAVFATENLGFVLMGEDDNERKADVWSFRPQ